LDEFPLLTLKLISSLYHNPTRGTDPVAVFAPRGTDPVAGLSAEGLGSATLAGIAATGSVPLVVFAPTGSVPLVVLAQVGDHKLDLLGAVPPVDSQITRYIHRPTLFIIVSELIGPIKEYAGNSIGGKAHMLLSVPHIAGSGQGNIPHCKHGFRVLMTIGLQLLQAGNQLMIQIHRLKLHIDVELGLK